VDWPRPILAALNHASLARSGLSSSMDAKVAGIRFSFALKPTCLFGHLLGVMLEHKLPKTLQTHHFHDEKFGARAEKRR
jgi:hypothetical protein